jgi:hypothetical protein
MQIYGLFYKKQKTVKLYRSVDSIHKSQYEVLIPNSIRFRPKHQRGKSKNHDSRHNWEQWKLKTDGIQNEFQQHK